MALANVAHWLYLRGRRVLMVDWDLEAPGLENFFVRSNQELERVQSHLGVIDLLSNYRRQAPYGSASTVFSSLPPLETFLVTITPDAIYPPGVTYNKGELKLLTAGWRAGDRFVEYAETVQGFDWSAFYERHRGEDYFNWFRSQLLSAADVVLIDSRTGVSEMSGVSTRQLADVVVVPCAPNAQNLAGTIDMVQSFCSPQVTKARGRSLEVLIIPARVDDADSKGHEEFRRRFRDAVKDFTPQVLSDWKRNPWELEIPYKAQYSYQESLVTGVDGANEKVDIAYRDLTAHLALLSDEGGPLWQACEPELKVIAARADRQLTDAAWRRVSKAVDGLDKTELAVARSVLIRLVKLDQHGSTLDTRRRASIQEFPRDALSMLTRLESLGAIARVSRTPDQPELYELFHEALVRNWTTLKNWIEHDREFLLWRQDISDSTSKWRDGGNDPSHLLRGSTLELSRRWEDRFHDLNAWERTFLAASENLGTSEREAAELERQRETERAQASRNFDTLQRQIGAAQLVAAMLLAVMAFAFVWLVRTIPESRNASSVAAELPALRAAAVKRADEVTLAEAFDKRMASVKSPSLRPSRRGVLTVRVAREQADWVRSQVETSMTRISGSRLSLAISAVVLTISGVLGVAVILGSRVSCQAFGQRHADRSESATPEWRNRFTLLTDALGSSIGKRPNLVSFAGLGAVLALQTVGLLLSVRLWQDELQFKALFVVVGFGTACCLAGAVAYGIDFLRRPKIMVEGN